MSMSTSLVWFRLDLRLADQPALAMAMRRGGAVVPVFIWAPEEEAPWEPGAASRWWLHQSLEQLDGALRARGSRLVIRKGPTLETLRELIRETGAEAVYWNRRYEPVVRARDGRIKEALRADGLVVESANAALLHEPWTIQNRSDKPFQVFTPFWRHCLGLGEPSEPLPVPGTMVAPKAWPRSEALEGLGLRPTVAWDGGLAEAWEPGEAGAGRQLESFVGEREFHYGEARNRPDQAGTSRLSPHLHFGEISPRQVWWGVRKAAEGRRVEEKVWRNGPFLAEVGWREFAYHLLYHFPHTPERPLREEFERFPWRRDAAAVRAWSRGRTGYALVDAGMRELWATGWMHNRVRMVVGSFLVKNLLVTWQEGARWFWDTLVDADLASNTLGWQWVSGCGADAAPYFRVFNPIRQGETHDPEGDYIRRWVPELGRLRAPEIHDPGAADAECLRAAGVTLGVQYPHPIVSHTATRMAALAAYQGMRG